MDNLTKEQRRKNMQNIKSSGTTPAKIIAKELRKRKIYFVQNVGKIIGKPDFVFRKKKVVVFVDSDFWHGNSKRFIMPKTNVKYWKKKIDRNRERDKIVNKQLKEEGWIVIRIWEYSIKHKLKLVLKKILKAIDKEQLL